ncbi:hypothetical protein F8O01_05240 [Pseudoclavibacter chungangensis]|uniref:Asparagine synthase n=1 Tax=Pseudoclavibacter chungangensis TaxID=587635 RepID=A0A7J5BZ81_9MICO|nr:hypothetical protein [Pseudoclavibacter chungangensis]KAB1659663.1 hypothetical protein F8O01_05240 [Pseudoclavibacter chungangensis]
MVWWRRERREPVSKQRFKDAERLVEEGLLIVATAIRMRVKNELILRTLQRGESFDRDELLELAREEIRTIVREKTASIKELGKMRARAARRHGHPTHGSDYRRADADGLEMRQRTDLGIRDVLLASLQDENYLASIVDQARASAMEEMFRPWFVSFASPTPEPSEDEDRPDRIADLEAEVQKLADEAEAKAAEEDAEARQPRKRRRWPRIGSSKV